MTRLNPKIDIAFKKIFGVEENKDLLISLINSVVSKEDQVSDLTLLNPYNPQNFRNDKLSILDIKAKNKAGELFNIEMQITDEVDYDKRSLYYWAKLYAEQLKSSDSYSSLSKTIGIHILNFISINTNDRYHNTFIITDAETNERFFPDFEMHTIELKKFPAHKAKEIGELVKKVHSALDVWIAFLTRNELLIRDNLPKEFALPELSKALEVMDTMNLSEEEREGYEAHLKWLRMENSAIGAAENKGMEKGLRKGLKKGLEKGKKEGHEEGKAAEKIKIAKNLIKKGMDNAFISQVTGLSKDEIEKLR